MSGTNNTVYGSDSTTTNTEGTGGAAGARAGEATKGLFGAIGGAGEAIRGTINSTLDGLGDGIAGRERGSVDSRSANENDNVAQKGMEQIKQGINQMTGEHKKTP